jgi:hypothetical protein
VLSQEESAWKADVVVRYSEDAVLCPICDPLKESGHECATSTFQELAPAAINALPEGSATMSSKKKATTPALPRSTDAVEGSTDVSITSTYVLEGSATNSTTAFETTIAAVPTKLQNVYEDLRGVLFFPQDTKLYEIKTRWMNQFIKECQVFDNLPCLEWEGSTNSEGGGICNAPRRAVKVSICYFSSAVQLLFRCISHSFKKKMPMYDAEITADDLRNMQHIVNIVNRLHNGENIPFDTNFSPKLA